MRLLHSGLRSMGRLLLFRTSPSSKVCGALLSNKVGHGCSEGPRGRMSGSLHRSLLGSIHEAVPVLFGVFAVKSGLSQNSRLKGPCYGLHARGFDS